MRHRIGSRVNGRLIVVITLSSVITVIIHSRRRACIAIRRSEFDVVGHNLVRDRLRSHYSFAGAERNVEP